MTNPRSITATINFPTRGETTTINTLLPIAAAAFLRTSRRDGRPIHRVHGVHDHTWITTTEDGTNVVIKVANR